MTWSSTFGPAQGTKGGQADGQVDGVHRRTSLPAASQHLVGEVQSGGRGGHRPGPVGVHRLVALRVGQRLADVGRQGHAPAGRQQLGGVGQQAHPAPAPRQPFAHLDGPVPGGGRGQDRPGRPGAGRGAPGPARPAGRPRVPVRAAAPRRLPPVALTSRSRAGITREVLTTSTSPSPDQAGQIPDDAVGDRSVGVGGIEQTGGVPWFDRPLGDGRVGQLVLGYLHGGRR